MKLNMRWMAKKDLKSVTKIQDSLFNSPRFNKEFFSSVVLSRKDPSFGFEGFNSFISYVCELDKKVVGYIIYKVGLLEFDKNLHSECMAKYRNMFPMSGEIVGFCVDVKHRRKGIGRHIVQSVLNRFSSVIELSLKESFSRPFVLYSVCSERDLDSHLFFKSMGFKGRNVRRDAFGEGHDGYTMVYESLPSKGTPIQRCKDAIK